MNSARTRSDISLKPLLARVALFLGLAVLGGCQGMPGAVFWESEVGVYHTVLEGQTLYSIAQAYDRDVDYLARLNGVDDPTKLRTGTRLWIPDAHRVLQVPTDGRAPPSRQAQGRSKSKQKQQTTKETAKKRTLIWPVDGVLTSGFGRRNGRNHDGIDIGAEKGTPIVAAEAGRVAFSGWGPTGYGRMVIVQHQGHITTLYAHNEKNLVKVGDKVVQGQRIALVGSTGRSTGPHLHFEVRNDTQPKNPLIYLKPRK
ncbi:MAG: M23 family metallopeptidase [Candidatus Nitrohelix vancouverensis]|uniref:M23 family metallopeptidase n=1 Tax=Candidatus Nitrohelix vancouverensis TaxID=2705534 RepID=A0A7T0C0C0_9BACT|nr:MAG: M23 family metallopeptidase [Candidatus Nitrohelix vancouverensis]